MAQIQLRLVPTSGANTTASVSVSDAHLNRMIAAFSIMYPDLTTQQLLDKLLRQMVDLGIATTKRTERNQSSVAEIPVT